jgi:hypothetical protein
MAISVKDNGSGKRRKGTFNLPGNFEVKIEGPLDTRTVVGSIADLLDTVNIDGENKYQYYGMLVVVSGDDTPENDGLYRLLEDGNPNEIGGWEKIGTGSSTSSAPSDDFIAHTGDTTIHFRKDEISLSEIGNSAHTHTLSEITDFNTYSGDVQTQINNKLNTSDFNTYSGSVDTQISGKLDTIDFNTYTGSVVDVYVTGGDVNPQTQSITLTNSTGGTISISNTEALFTDTNSYVTGGTYNETTGIVTYETSSGFTFDVSGFTTGITDTFVESGNLVGTTLKLTRSDGDVIDDIEFSGLVSDKLNITDFNNYSGGVETQISGKLNTSDFDTYSGSVDTQISGKLDNSDFDTYSGSVETQLSNKVETASNVGSGEGLFSGKSGTDLQFRSISGGTNVTATTVGDTVVISSTGGNQTSSDTYNSEFTTPTVEKVGGITSNTAIAELEGKTLSEILDLMLFPTQTPSSSGPSTSLTLNGLGTIYEIGQTLNITFNTTANRGNWTPSYGSYTQPSTHAGDVTNAVIAYNGGGSSTVDGDSLTIVDGINIADPTDNYTVVAGNNSWTLTTTFAAGDDPVNSKGETLIGSGYAGGTKTATDSFQGTYPVYVIEEAGTFRKLSLMSLSTNTIVVEIDFAGTATNAPTFEFQIPTAFGTPNKIVQFNPISGQYGTEDQLGNQWILTPLTRNTDHDNGVSYHQFKWDDTKGLIGASKFKITLS